MNHISALGIMERQRRICRDSCTLVFMALLILPRGVFGAETKHPVNSYAISKEASIKCAAKFREIQAFDQDANPQKKKSTRFNEDQINSYLALELQSNFGPSLKGLRVEFKEDSLKIEADIDFDSFREKSNGISERLFAAVVSGIHTLTATGRLHAQGGEAYFELWEARIDEQVVPKILVEQIISGVSRRQKPPFDPLQPSQMPYHIKSIDVHAEMIIVYQ
jgi:hypothetical protein